MIHDALTCPFNHYHMGITAENVAEKFGVSRHEQVPIFEHKDIFHVLFFIGCLCHYLVAAFRSCRIDSIFAAVTKAPI